MEATPTEPGFTKDILYGLATLETGRYSRKFLLLFIGERLHPTANDCREIKPESAIKNQSDNGLRFLPVIEVEERCPQLPVGNVAFCHR